MDIAKHAHNISQSVAKKPHDNLRVLWTIKLGSAWPGYCMEQSWFWQKYQMTSHMSWRPIGTAASFFRQAHMP